MLSKIPQDPALLTSTSICVAVVALYVYYKYTYSYWKRKGIAGPKIVPFLGNTKTLLMTHRGKAELAWTKEFGNLIGIYRGRTPALIVADPEVILQLCIKDFEAATNHENSPDFFTKYFKSFIFNTVDDQWKRIRTLLSPTFTSGKIKKMFRNLNECADDAIECFKEQLQVNKKAIVNGKDLFSLYTMDGITRFCYGIKLDRDSSKTKTVNAVSRDDFTSAALKVFEFSAFRSTLISILPKWILRSCNFTLKKEKSYIPIASRTESLIRARQKSTQKHDDFLQLLIDARPDSKLELNELDKEENHHAGLTVQSLQKDQDDLLKSYKGAKKLTEDEIIAQAVFFLAVGMETTSSLLTHTAYLLAFNPEVQEKLYHEVCKIATQNNGSIVKEFEYESLTSCKYLDAVLSETLRMFPPFVSIQRQLKKDYRIEKYNLDLPKDMVVFLGVYSVQNNDEYWEKPEEYNPERFMPGNREKIIPGSYGPFGLGPRHCVGMRFSLTEAKLGLAKIVSCFRFKPAPGREFSLDPQIPLGLLCLDKPIFQLEAR